VKLANTLRTNAAKIGGSTVESPNAFIPGEGSVAEHSAAYAQSGDRRVPGARAVGDVRESAAGTY
jgi:hypothetical protein